METSERQRQILTAASACFTRFGFHGASMQQICAEAGMSAGALYRHYPSKAAIIVAIAEAERAQHALMFEGLDTSPEPLETLREIGTAFLRRQLEGTDELLTADVVAEAGRNPEIRVAFERNAALVHETLCRTLLRGQGLGVVDPGLDVPAACTLLIALGDGLCSAHAGVPGMTVDRLADAMGLLLKRFCSPPAGPGGGAV